MKLWLCLAAVICVASLGGRVWWSARVELETAQALEGENQLKQAIEHYQYAARWWLPWTQAPAEARAALFRIGTECEESRRPELALRAYRRLRGAILSTRWLLSVADSRRPVVEKRIATLMATAQLARGGPESRDESLGSLTEHHLELLRHDPVPTAGISFAVLVSFMGWIASIVWTIRRGLTRDLSIRRKPFILGLSLAGVFFAIWCLSLMRA